MEEPISKHVQLHMGHTLHWLYSHCSYELLWKVLNWLQSWIGSASPSATIVLLEVIDEVTVEATRRKSELKDTCKNMDRKIKLY